MFKHPRAAPAQLEPRGTIIPFSILDLSPNGKYVIVGYEGHEGNAKPGPPWMLTPLCQQDSGGGTSARRDASPPSCLDVDLKVTPNPVQSGMSLTPGGTYPVGFFTGVYDSLACVSGCEDVKITVTDAVGVPVSGADVDVSVTSLSDNPNDVTPLNGGGFFTQSEHPPSSRPAHSCSQPDSGSQHEACFCFSWVP